MRVKKSKEVTKTKFEQMGLRHLHRCINDLCRWDDLPCTHRKAERDIFDN
jgi:hypothetical protein